MRNSTLSVVHVKDALVSRILPSQQHDDRDDDDDDDGHGHTEAHVQRDVVVLLRTTGC